MLLRKPTQIKWQKNIISKTVRQELMEIIWGGLCLGQCGLDKKK